MKTIGIVVTLIVAMGTLTVIGLHLFLGPTDSNEIKKDPVKDSSRPKKNGNEITKEEIEKFVDGKQLTDTYSKKHEKVEESKRKIEQLINEMLSKAGTVGEEERLKALNALIEACKEDIEQMPPLEQRLLKEQLDRLNANDRNR